MTEASNERRTDLEDLMRRLDEARNALVEVLGKTPPAQFDAQNPEGESIKHALDRTVDDVNFYYGRLIARALNLPQPPCLTKADFGSMRESSMALQVAHRRLTNLLHDVLPDDLEKVAADPELGTFTLRQVLEMAAAQYRMRAQQVQRLAAHAHPA
ncbi:MAG TPA: DinB family protein [Dehalococcoidia bacterium]|jgi:hypothetical protein|nr:DinB family protein [Dehalococcoidia bacterium]